MTPDLLTQVARGLAFQLIGILFIDAIDAYSKALDRDRDMASSYYGRGLASQKVGDKSGGDDDIATAKRIDPEIEKTFRK